MAEESARKAAILAKKVLDTNSNDDEGESDQEGDESSDGETATAAAELSAKKRKVAAVEKELAELKKREEDDEEEEDDEKPAKKKKRLVVVDERTVNFASNFCVCKRVWGSNLMSLVFLMTGSVVQAFGAKDGTETSKIYRPLVDLHVWNSGQNIHKD